MESNNLWKVTISSFANRNNLSDSQLDKIFTCYNRDKYQDFKKEMTEKNKEYDKYPVAKWQLEKANSIEKLWHNSIKYSIIEDVVSVSVSLDVEFPTEFDKDDVLMWVEGFTRLNLVYNFVQMEDIVAEIEIDRNENVLLNELVDNQKFDRKRIF